MAQAMEETGDGRGARWVCPECGGDVRAEGRTEREAVRCGGCGVRFRHPRMAVLLSLALPGLGSIHQRHRLFGAAVMGFGSAAFGGTVWRIFQHLRQVLVEGVADVAGILVDSAIGTGLVILAYLLDLLVVWVRRGRLVRQ